MGKSKRPTCCRDNCDQLFGLAHPKLVLRPLIWDGDPSTKAELFNTKVVCRAHREDF